MKYSHEDIEPVDPLGAWKGLMNLLAMEAIAVAIGLFVWWLASWM